MSLLPEGHCRPDSAPKVSKVLLVTLAWVEKRVYRSWYMYCIITVSASVSCLPLYINWLHAGCVLCSSEMDTVMHPGAWLWECSKKSIRNNLLKHLPLIGLFGCEVAISVILKFAHKYACLLDVTCEMCKRIIISKNAEMWGGKKKKSISRNVFSIMSLLESFKHKMLSI